MNSYCDLDTIVTNAAALLFTPERIDVVKITGVIDIQIVGVRKDDDTRALIFLEFIEEINLSAPLQVDLQGECPLRFYVQYTRSQELYVDVPTTLKVIIKKLMVNTSAQIRAHKANLKGLESVLVHFG